VEEAVWVYDTGETRQWSRALTALVPLVFETLIYIDTSPRHIERYCMQCATWILAPFLRPLGYNMFPIRICRWLISACFICSRHIRLKPPTVHAPPKFEKRDVGEKSRYPGPRQLRTPDVGGNAARHHHVATMESAPLCL
jgi:hypothetical protein